MASLQRSLRITFSSLNEKYDSVKMRYIHFKTDCSLPVNSSPDGTLIASLPNCLNFSRALYNLFVMVSSLVKKTRLISFTLNPHRVFKINEICAGLVRSGWQDANIILSWL